jgi:hypothetical protein
VRYDDNNNNDDDYDDEKGKAIPQMVETFKKEVSHLYG